jgi:hypothetical protein
LNPRPLPFGLDSLISQSKCQGSDLPLIYRPAIGGILSYIQSEIKLLFGSLGIHALCQILLEQEMFVC